MFVGHLALALVGKRADPSVSLGWFVAAATMLDLVWPIFLLLGLEQVRIVPGAMAFGPLVFDSYPWSHSLMMAVAWGVLLGAVARWRSIAPATAYLLAALVVSHWVLDFITHAPDLPLWPEESPRLGLGLWNSVTGTFVVEGALWVGAIVFYLRGRRATSWIGRVAFWSFVLLCTAMWVSQPWSAPPPSARAVAWFGLVGWIAIPWTALADRYSGGRSHA